MRQAWNLAAAILVCAAIAGAIYWRSLARDLDAAGLIQCLPQDQATHVYIDVAALRKSGILDLLAGSKAAEDAEYRAFVAQTGFDYRTDLDAVAVAFFHDDVYCAVRGRFALDKLSHYVELQGGHCHNSVCEMPASTPGREISFYPLRSGSGLLALAVSKQPLAATVVGPQHWRTPPSIHSEPLWISAPAFAFSDVSAMPAGTHSFLSPLAQAQAITFTAAPAPKSDRLELRLDVTCNTPEAAVSLAKQLSDTTDLLKKMLVRDHLTPNASDLSGVLVAGTFAQQDKRVTGIWPVERSFVEALVAGKIQ